MKDMTRLSTLSLLAPVALLAVAMHSNAQTYPTKPVRLIVPFAPGAAQDLTGRLVAQKLTEAWQQQVIVDNRPGAGSSIGAELAARSVADGYTLLLANEALAINATLMRKLPFDPLKDFAPISNVVINPRIFVANPSLGNVTVKDIIAMAKSKPGSVRYGSSGVGTGPHLAAALLASMSKTEMTHVPYKGAAPAMTDVMAGHIEMVAATIMSAMPFIQSGKLKPIAVTSARRSAALPDVPTVAESALPGYQATAWSMLLAPAKMPQPIIAKIHGDTARFLEQPDVKARLAREGAEPSGISPKESGEFLKAEVARWAKVIQEAGLHGEN
jgi:tripartite-type tricarboxylate transporter receptor subunit TctC